MRVSRKWLTALVAVSLPACLVAAGTHQRKASAQGITAPSYPPAEAAGARRARLLAHEPVAETVALGSFSARRQVRQMASVLSRRIPLPRGGNFNGIRWEKADGTLTTGQIDATLEFNAACQWLRALRDGREIRTAASVLQVVGRWPAFRAQGADAPWLRRALTRSGGSEYLAMLAGCDASHAREVRYARAQGWRPST